MNNEPLISVLVPVYNGEKYLPDIFKSLKNQTYKNFEVILVDDLSTDSSARMIEETAKEDSRFKLIKRDTKGGTAISGIVYGINYCCGEYFSYLSQDDFIDDDYLEKLLNKALKTKADIVLSNMIFYYENKKIKKAGKFPFLGLYNLPISNKKAFLASLKWHIGAVGLKSMDLMKKVNYRADYYNDDEFYNRKSFLLANKIVFANTNFYYRQDNTDAITKNIKHYTFDIITTDIKLANLLIEYNYPKRIIDKRFKELLISYSEWINVYKDKKELFSPEERLYVQNLLKDAKNNLETTIQEKNLFFSKLYLQFHKLEEIKNEQ